MDRLKHLQQTLPENLSAVSGDSALEFVVLNYNSSDNVDRWIRTSGILRDQRVRYFQEKTAKWYDSAHAKNVAHLLAAYPLICNLDADNFITDEFVTYLRNAFKLIGERRAVLQCSKTYSGTCGRIAMHRDTLQKLRGYNEALRGYGGDDLNLMTRASNCPELRVYPMLPAPDVSCIEHDDKARLSKMPPGFTTRAASRANNHQLDQYDRRNKIVRTNLNKMWGQAVVFDVDGNRINIGAT